MSYLETLTGLIAVELTGNPLSKAWAKFDGFADTQIDAEIEPTERDSWLAKLTEEV